MQINDNWKVESDEMGVTLFQKRVKGKDAKKPGDEYWCPEGYYPNCQAALRGIIRAEINGTGLKDFQTVCNKLDELEELIRNIKGVD